MALLSGVSSCLSLHVRSSARCSFKTVSQEHGPCSSDQSLGEQLDELVASKVKNWTFGVVLSGKERADMQDRARPLVGALFERIKRFYAQVIVWSLSQPRRSSELCNTDLGCR